MQRQLSIRLVSYNVHACIGRDGQFMPGRILDILKPLDADLIALQEVEDRPYLGRTVSEYFAEQLDAIACRGSTLRRGNADYGNLLLAKQQAEAINLHDISVTGGEPRGAIEADFRFFDRRLKLVATHLGLTAKERRRQISQLLATLNTDDSDTTVFAGDVNEWRPLSYPLRALRRRFGAGSAARTFPSGLPLLALDRVYVVPQGILAHCTAVSNPESRIASDHLPLVCDLLLGANGDAG